MAGRTTKSLTMHLRQLAKEAHSVADDESIITKAEAMADLLWKYALGWEEPDPDDPDKRIKHKPQQWAMTMIYDRLEGKAANAMEDTNSVMTAADKVGEMAKNQVNALTMSVVGNDNMPSGPPPYKKKGDDVSE
jgi:hypothetical protein